MTKSVPFCSIIILNYFGEKIIENTVATLVKLHYPQNRYEIIIVDNNSKDKSKEIIASLEKKYKNISSILLNKNLGFSRGNNVGIKIAKGEYVALLNNDCIVEKDWLSELVKVAKSNQKIFAVNSKILLYPRYFKTHIQIENKATLTKVFLSKSNLIHFNNEQLINIDFEIKDNKAMFEVPFDAFFDTQVELYLRFNATPKFNSNIFKKTEELYSYVYKVDVKNKSLQTYDKIQNAGIIPFYEGSGRDIGAVVRMHNQKYERDIGQYEKDREIYAASAGAALYNKKILERIGYFSEDFFFYYEDMDISERARFFGYTSFYAHGAIARHLHAFSSKEWSSFFVYNAEKGRFLHTFYNFPYSSGIIFFGFLHICMMTTLRMIRAIVGESSISHELPYLKVMLFFISHFPILTVKKKLKYNQKQRELIKKNYQDILSGKWYFD